MSSTNTKFVFLDTNIYLHFHPIEEMNLPQILSTNHATILVPRKVVTELDGHKDTHASPKVRKRARSLLKKIDDIEDLHTPSPVRKGVDLLCFFDSVIASVWDEYDVASNDDNILASLLTYKLQNPEANVVFITNDAGARTKARMLEIQTFKLPKSLKYDDPIGDPLKAANRKLQNEINLIKSAQPKIRLTFENQTQNREINRRREVIDIPREIERAMRDSPGLGIRMKIPSAQKANYERKLERYYRNLQHYKDASSSVFQFKLHLSNTGTVPAEELDLIISFPFSEDILSIGTAREAVIASPPVEPERPLYPSSLIARALSSHPKNLIQQLPHLPLPKDYSFKIIEDEDETLFRVRLNKLKHDYTKTIPLFLKFERPELIQSFHANFSIRLANTPKKKDETLHFILFYHP